MSKYHKSADEPSMLEKSLVYGVNFRNEPNNARVNEREQEDFKVKYTETIEKLVNRYNILLNEKIRDIKLFYIQEYKELYLELENSNITRGKLLINLDKRVERRIRILTDWLKDMQFIWSFFTVNNTRFRLEDNNKYLDLIRNISTDRDLLGKTLDDIDREIGEILGRKYKFTEESRGTHGGSRATQRKRTPRRRKVVQTRKKRY